MDRTTLGLFIFLLFYSTLLYFLGKYVNEKADTEHFSQVPSGTNVVLSDSKGNLTAFGITDFLNAAHPVGSIIAWKGDINNVPAGWNLCDGSNNTPDLRARFIVGFNKDRKEFAMGYAGGEEKHILTADEMPSHDHPINPNVYVHDRSFKGDGGDDHTLTNGADDLYFKSTGSSGNNAPHENMPPYIAFAYIIKV